MDRPLDCLPAAVTAGLVVLTIRDDALAVLLVRHGEQPFPGRLALPGGNVRPGESLDAAAIRELREQTGLAAAVHLEQLATYGDPGRDPRGHIVTVVYLVLAPRLPVQPAGRAGQDAAASWVPLHGLRERLAFDHNRILADGLERARAKLEYTSLATAFCPAEFTVAQLRRVYEIVWGAPVDPRNFHRKVTGTPGFLAPARGTTIGGRGRPARLFRCGDAQVLYPPMLQAPVR
jgi:8-oxo-dGTP diphosphatase